MVYINGFPGTGKLTIAKMMCDALAHSNTIIQAPILIDNHMLIDPVGAVLPRTHPDYRVHRKAMRSQAFRRYVERGSNSNSIVIFTDFQASDEMGKEIASEYMNAAERGGRKFIPIILTVDLDENKRRMITSDRADGYKCKLTNTEKLGEIREEYKLLRFDPGAQLELDVTYISPEIAALKIGCWVLSLMQEQKGKVVNA